MENCPRCGRPLDGALYCLHCHALVTQENTVDAEEAGCTADTVKSVDEYPAVMSAKKRVLVTGILSAVSAAAGVLILTIEIVAARFGKSVSILFPLFFLVAALIIFRIIFQPCRREYKAVRTAYTDYGDLEAIYRQVNATALYTDDYLLTNGTYIISKSEHHLIVLVDEVVNVYRYERKRNLATVAKGLFFVKRNGEKVFMPASDASAQKILLILKKLLPEVNFGYAPGV